MAALIGWKSLLGWWALATALGLCGWWVLRPPPCLRGGPIFACGLCAETTADAAGILEHLRLFHPDKYEGELERWPDGKPVIYESLEPQDFA